MKLTAYRVRLPLLHEFTIARSSLTTQSSVIVELEDDGFHGYGEVTEDAFYGHSYESIVTSLKRAAPRLDEYLNHSPRDVWSEMRDTVQGDAAL